MRKEDRLHPVITLTSYYGEKQWDGPYCLKDMIVEMPEEIAAIFSDYKMNLLEVRDSAKYVFNNTDVQSVFEITREAFAGHFDRIREKYGEKELDSELLTVIGQMTGSKELVNMGRNMEVNNMCTALEKLKEDGKMEGLQEGLQEGRQKGLQEGLQEGKREGMQEKEKAVILVMLKNNYPISEICKISGATEETVLGIKESIK